MRGLVWPLDRSVMGRMKWTASPFCVGLLLTSVRSRMWKDLAGAVSGYKTPCEERKTEHRSALLHGAVTSSHPMSPITRNLQNVDNGRKRQVRMPRRPHLVLASGWHGLANPSGIHHDRGVKIECGNGRGGAGSWRRGSAKIGSELIGTGTPRSLADGFGVPVGRICLLVRRTSWYA